MRHNLFIIITILLWISTLSPSCKEKKEEISAEEYDVYSAYLDGFDKSPNDGKAVKLVVVNGKTEGPAGDCLPEGVAKYSEGIAVKELKPLLEELLVKNKTSVPLQNLFKIKHNSVLLDENDFADFFKNRDFEGWDDFYKKYPDSSGFITVSRVGFDKKLTKAILYKSMSCGSLCGSGDYILFEKTDGKWKAVNWFNCWIS
jgi:hypothetical protein